MARRKLIFFTTSDPAADPSGLFRAYHFAGVAASAGLEAEVRLAGEAVTVTDPAVLPDTDLAGTSGPRWPTRPGPPSRSPFDRSPAVPVR